MNFYQYLKLTKEEKLELLTDEGEYLESLDSKKDLYQLFSFYVIANLTEEEDIASIRAFLHRPGRD